MALNNLYLGATQTELGASYLDTKTLVNINEGFQIGSTIEYINVGQYEIDSFNNNGPFSQNTRIEASNRLNRLKHNIPTFSRELVSGAIFRDDFNDINTIDRNYTSIGQQSGGVTSGVYRLATGTSGLDIKILNKVPGIRDTRVIMKATVTNTPGTDTRVGLYLRTLGQSIGYRVEVGGGQLNLIRQADAAVLDNTAQGISSGLPFWLMAIVKGNKLYGYFSTDGLNYTAKVSATDDTRFLGDVGFRINNLTGSHIFDIDYFDLVEIEDQVSIEDTLRTVSAMGDVQDINITDKFNDISDFESNAGASWIIGITNGVQQIDGFNGGGASLWSIITSAGNSFNDFILKYEFTGSSGAVFGSLVGSTNNWYGNYHQLDNPTNNNTIENILTGISRFSYQNRGEYFNPLSDRWYKGKIVKRGLGIYWYVNDNLVNAIYGTSLSNALTGVSNNIGFFLRKEGGPDKVSFRNIRISSLDLPVDTILINQNNTLDSMFTRYLPEGFAAINGSTTVDIFEIGASRGSHGVTNTILSTNEEISNIAGEDNIIVSGEVLSLQVTSNDRVSRQIDSNRTTSLYEPSVDDVNNAQKRAAVAFSNSNRNINSVGLQLPTRPTIETFDTINYNNDLLGISKQFIIYSQSKSFNSVDGSIRQTFKLGTQNGN